MTNENGRSMVEMLGVLAIIGVLSVAGIAGYTMAMRKYRTNEILNTASQLVVLARAMDGGNGGTATMDMLGVNAVAGYVMSATCNATHCTVSTTSTKGDEWNDASNAVSSGTYYTFS